MAYLRKLPSGKWQATVRGADGRKHTRTDALRSVVKAWATDEESKIARGMWRDPRIGQTTFEEWADRWFGARVVEAETRRGDRGVLDNHILPHWRTWVLVAITAFDVQSWIRAMEKAGTGRHAIRRAYNLFATMCADAVTADMLAASPCGRHIDLPATPMKLAAWFTREQVDLIRAELDPRHRGHSVMTELMCLIGLRWGEAAGLRATDVDWLRGRLSVHGVLTQHGKWKEYPKSSKSRRSVPIPRYLLDEMAALLTGRQSSISCACELSIDHLHIFVTNRGQRPLSGANWRVVWYDAIDRANARIAEANRGRPESERVEPVPRDDPHNCRHTAASWLVQEGVPLYDVQALLGHESYVTTQRYAHLAPDAHGAVEKAWERIAAHQRRTATAVDRRKAT